MLGIVIKEKIQNNTTLLEMRVGTVLFGVLCQAGVVWFVKDKAGFSIGLWLGITAAVQCMVPVGTSASVQWMEKDISFFDGRVVGVVERSDFGGAFWSTVGTGKLDDGNIRVCIVINDGIFTSVCQQGKGSTQS